MEDVICVDDFERLAKECLDNASWQYFRTGTGDEITLTRNRASFQDILLRQACLSRDVSSVELGVELVGGTRLAFPVGVAPTAFHVLAHPRAELETAKGARRAGSVLTLSPCANHSQATVRAEAGLTAALWQDIYIWRDRQNCIKAIRAAEAAGFRAVVVSCDNPVLSSRREHIKTSRILFKRSEATDAWPPMIPRDTEILYRSSDPAATWEDFATIARSTKLPVIAKGITSAEDARKAVDSGAAAIWVSTHGGRQMDSLPGTMEVLGEVVDAVGGRVDVYVDSGVRTGIDVFKALALGAKAVFVGRPVIYGLAVDVKMATTRMDKDNITLSRL